MSADVRPRDPPDASRPRPGARPAARRWLLRALLLAGALLVVHAAWRASAAAGGERLGPDAALVRGARRVAAIERVSRARGRGRLPLYLAPAAGAVIDSARVGALAARLEPGAADADPVVALVPRDSVAGLALVGRLVVTPGEPGLLVFGTRVARRP